MSLRHVGVASRTFPGDSAVCRVREAVVQIACQPMVDRFEVGSSALHYRLYRRHVGFLERRGAGNVASWVFDLIRAVCSLRFDGTTALCAAVPYPNLLMSRWICAGGVEHQGISDAQGSR